MFDACVLLSLINKKGGLIRGTNSSSQALSDVQMLEKQVIVGRVALLRLSLDMLHDLEPRGSLTKPGEKDVQMMVDTGNAQLMGHKDIWQNCQAEE